MLTGGEDAVSVGQVPDREVGEAMKGLRRISDLTKRTRLRALGGIGKAVPYKVIKGKAIRPRKVK